MKTKNTCRTITLRITPELETALAHFPRERLSLSSQGDATFDERWMVRQVAAEAIFTLADYYAAGAATKWRQPAFELSTREPRRNAWRQTIKDVKQLLRDLDQRIDDAETTATEGGAS